MVAKKTCSDYFHIYAGGDLNKEDFSVVSDGTYRYEIFSNSLTNRGLYGFTRNPKYEGDSITITGRGTIGVAFYRQKPFDAIIRLLVLIPKDKGIVDCRYFTNYINNAIVFHKESTGVPQLTVPQVEQIKITLPPIEEQKAIAKVLTELDEFITKLDRRIEKKQAVRDGILEDLISGKRRLPGFADKWENHGFMTLINPKARIGWQGLKKAEYLKSGYSLLIAGTDFNDGMLEYDSMSYVSKERYEMDTNIQIENNDVLVTKDGTIGKVAIVKNLTMPATLASGVFVFKVISDKLTPNFLYYILCSSAFEQFIKDLSAGSTIKHLYQKDLKNLSFNIPGMIEEQIAITAFIENLDTEISFVKEKRTKYENIKLGLTDDLLTGRVRLNVKEVQ